MTGKRHPSYNQLHPKLEKPIGNFDLWRPIASKEWMGQHYIMIFTPKAKMNRLIRKYGSEACSMMT